MTKKTKAKVKASQATSKVFLKRAFYLALVAVPAVLIFRNKAAVVAAAAIAYDQILEASEHIAEKAEVLLDKAKEFEIG